jgi:8-oxo-dGTP diphosphatase
MNKKEVEVVAAVIHKGDLFYVVQRPFKGEVGGKWEFPGGKIEIGESKEQALARELKEELNIEVMINEHILTSDYEYNSFKIRIHFYECKIKNGIPKLAEHINEKWLLKSQIQEIDLASADIAVLDYI